jgi:ankyrin repeat protein
MDDASQINLSIAVRSGDVLACQRIIDTLTTTAAIAAAARLAVSEDGLTPLAVAAKTGSASLCEVFVDRGLVAEGDADASGKTPLHHAAASGLGLEILRILPFHVDAVDAGGRTALHLACANGRSQTVEDLLRLGANPDVADLESGDTPLHHATRAGDVTMCEALLRACRGGSANAAISKRNIKGDTPRGIAYSTPHQAFMYLFLQKTETDRIVTHPEDRQEEERQRKRRLVRRMATSWMSCKSAELEFDRMK